MSKNTLRKACIKLLIAACASLVVSLPSFAETSNTPSRMNAAYANDPYQPFNRAMFKFNENLDVYLLKPLATTYVYLVPKPYVTCIHNFFRNLGELPTIANDLLQLKFRQFANDSWRFGLNSTIGLFGLLDPASHIQLPYYSNDFGMTLATYGYKNSNYLVLPFWGPTTIRDGIGAPVDVYAFSIYSQIESNKLSYSLFGVSILDTRANLIQYQSVMDAVAIDKYVFAKNAYLQYRSNQIAKNARVGY